MAPQSPVARAACVLYKGLLKKKVILALAIVTYVILKYPHLAKPPTFKDFYKTDTDHPEEKLEDAPLRPRANPAAIDGEIDEIFSRIEQLIPKVTFIHWNTTTSAEKSRSTMINPKDKYCIGDHLTVQLDMFDYLGNRKKYGGDFFMSRINSPELGAAASGKIEDFNNGTYHVHFTLFWEGAVKVSILLLHPSEAVAAIWKARNTGYGNIDFFGTFINRTQNVHTECGFDIQTEKELCEYLDERDGEFFYCIKPAQVPCEAFTSMMSINGEHSYLSDLEKPLIHRSNIAKEMKRPFESIAVFQCNKSGPSMEEKCNMGMRTPFPSGYFLTNVWHPVSCTMSSTNTEDQMSKCLQGKRIYLMGDSTLRQWFGYFTSTVKTLRDFNLHEGGNHGTIRAVDMGRNIQIEWKRHGHPFLTESVYNVRSLVTAARAIDQLVGGAHTVIVISLGHHFRPFPLTLLLRRLIGVRKAVERLLTRSPDTKFIVKTENNREFSAEPERLSDFHGYIHYLATKLIFQGVNVGLVDAWDMSIASASYTLHPPHSSVANHINMFLTYIC